MAGWPCFGVFSKPSHGSFHILFSKFHASYFVKYLPQHNWGMWIVEGTGPTGAPGWRVRSANFNTDSHYFVIQNAGNSFRVVVIRMLKVSDRCTATRHGIRVSDLQHAPHMCGSSFLSLHLVAAAIWLITIISCLRESATRCGTSRSLRPNRFHKTLLLIAPRTRNRNQRHRARRSGSGGKPDKCVQLAV